MVRLILPPAASTDSTRTFTSWLTSSSSSTLSTKPSLIWVMCTRPSAVAVPSSVFRVTKAPKGAILATLPVSHCCESMLSKAETSAGPRGAPPPPPKAPGCFMERLILPWSGSTDRIRTCTSWPSSSTSPTSERKPSWICEMCTRPSAVGPPSGNVTDTKAPKDAILATVPAMNSSGETSWNGVTSARARGPPSSLPSTMVSPNLPSSLLPLTQTSTSWPSSK
mmetsp:Transcript_66591/g.189052  ORF Transcript_66591/g.189052 Transcript_66591/m.189052 type:complete len:223 (+) Transcript_66591:90-758(+)